jgi:hypothetical protein
MPSDLHESVCERRWDGHLAIVKIDDVSGFVDNIHFLIMHLITPLSLSLSFINILGTRHFKMLTNEGAARKTSDYMALLLSRGGAINYKYHHHPKEPNPPLENFPETNDGPIPPTIITTTINHGRRGIYISAGIGETASYVINPQKQENSRRIGQPDADP